MWDQYRKTFWAMQVVIALITLLALVRSHRALVGGAFFLAMQVGAVAGAAWSVRLRGKGAGFAPGAALRSPRAWR